MIDTGEFLAELTAGRDLTDKGYLVTPEDFSQFCLARNLQPRLVKRHLYAAGRIEGSTEDGGKMMVYCNIGPPEDVSAMLSNDGRGIGLFRSEFLCLASSDYPSEDDQFQAYKQVAAAMGGQAGNHPHVRYRRGQPGGLFPAPEGGKSRFS